MMAVPPGHLSPTRSRDGYQTTRRSTLQGCSCVSITLPTRPSASSTSQCAPVVLPTSHVLSRPLPASLWRQTPRSPTYLAGALSPAAPGQSPCRVAPVLCRCRGDQPAVSKSPQAQLVGPSTAPAFAQVARRAAVSLCVPGTQ